ncbi:MAG TPA: hypothetical protein VN888_24170 [Mycobacterium sp.]|jgi:hypothetical protein|nr:hypothetical protein [Mycobacterium sp.]
MSFETVARQTLYRQVRARSSDLSDLRCLADRKLLARGGRYAELYDTQFGNQPDPEDVVAA